MVLPQPRAERDELIEIREPVRLGNQNAGEDEELRRAVHDASIAALVEICQEHSPTLAHAYRREQSKTRTLDLNIANAVRMERSAMTPSRMNRFSGEHSRLSETWRRPSTGDGQRSPVPRSPSP